MVENESGKRGLFNPQSRPPSGLFNRPTSAMNKQSQEKSRSNNDVRGPWSRPSSAYSRPTSAYRPGSRAGSALGYEM